MPSATARDMVTTADMRRVLGRYAPAYYGGYAPYGYGYGYRRVYRPAMPIWRSALLWRLAARLASLLTVRHHLARQSWRPRSVSPSGFQRLERPLQIDHGLTVSPNDPRTARCKGGPYRLSCQFGNRNHSLMSPASRSQHFTRYHLSVPSNRSRSGLILFDLFEEYQCLRGGVRNGRLLVADPCSPLREYPHLASDSVIA
jgi:hypothetical protein